jgi:hypothetical protein
MIPTRVGLAVAALAVTVTACAAPTPVNYPQDSTTGAATTAIPDTIAVTTPDAPVPSPSDFAIGINVLRKKCFGSAGCNITFRINPKYIGTTSFSGGTLTVVYEVTGGDSGVQINNFTVGSDGTASFPQEETTSTASSGTTLSAKATSVSAG